MVIEREKREECYHNIRNALGSMQDIRNKMQKAVEISAAALIDCFAQMHRIGEAVKECERCSRQLEHENEKEDEKE